MNHLTFIRQLAAVVFLISSISASAQWNKKPYAEWSEEESQKVLADSPWVANERFVDLGSQDLPSRNPDPKRDYDYTKSDPTRGASNTGSMKMKISAPVNCHVRLLSARPTREAFARSSLVRDSGEKITGHIKAISDADFANYIIIAISCGSKEPGGLLTRVQVALTPGGTVGGQGRVNLEDTFLETKGGQRVLPERYQPPRDNRLGALLMFPRFVNGKPFIAPESGELRFHMNPYKTLAIDVRFKVKDMMYEGKLEY